MISPQSPLAVVVPTRNRASQLRRCLAALAAQDVELEIVVVDDGSGDAAAVSEAAGTAGARLVRLDGVGPAAARNAGVRAARASIVCLTDDDCEPESSWARLLSAPVRSGAAAASGRITAASASSPADRAWCVIVEHLRGEGSHPGSPSPGFASTANLCCSRALLEELPFDESFPLAAGEDRDWCARATKRGSAPIRIDDAVVVHRPDLSGSAFLRQQYRYGRGAARYRGAAPDRRSGRPGFYARLLLAGARAGPGPFTLVLFAQVATVAGVLAERLAARRR